MCHVYSLTAILVGWVIFAADSLPNGVFEYLKTMFGMGASPLWSGTASYELSRNAITLIIMLFASTPLPKKLFERISGNSTRKKFIENIFTVIFFIL